MKQYSSVMPARQDTSVTGGFGGEVRELGHTVGLGPETNFAGHRLLELVIEHRFAVEVAGQRRAMHGDFQFMPGTQLQRKIFRAAFDEGTLAVVEGPEHNVVFGTIEAH